MVHAEATRKEPVEKNPREEQKDEVVNREVRSLGSGRQKKILGSGAGD